MKAVAAKNRGGGRQVKPSPQTLKHVALIVESAVAPRRMMLSGVARYIQEHEPWAVYLKPHAVELSLVDGTQPQRAHGSTFRP